MNALMGTVCTTVTGFVASGGTFEQSHRFYSAQWGTANICIFRRRSQSSSNCSAHEDLRFCSPPLTLWHWEECMEEGGGGMVDGWINEGGEGIPWKLCLWTYLESLLMTRIRAPFSSFRRWLSALRSTRTWRNKEKLKLNLFNLNLIGHFKQPSGFRRQCQ